MYYPIQIPYVLNSKFKQYINYSETIVDETSDFVLCFWQTICEHKLDHTVKNIIIPDGCIDLIVNYNKMQIGFVGMSVTDFDFEIITPCKFFGVRLKPGAFFWLTDIPAVQAMDNFIPIDAFDCEFDKTSFFSMPFEQGKQYIQQYIINLSIGKTKSSYINLFDDLYSDIPDSAAQLYNKLNLNPRKCQRLFLQHYGISPKIVLNVLRFQNALEHLLSNNYIDYNMSGYYDQPHYIKDIKKNIGVTPKELIKKYV